LLEVLARVADPAGLVFPYAPQAIQIVRRRRLGRRKKWSRETVRAIRSPTVIQASLAELAASPSPS
jgi:hypothetical protein